MASVRVIHRWKSESAKPVLKPVANVPVNGPAAAPKIVAIVASTGGPSALSEIVQSLPAEFPLPVVIVQHMTSDFIPSLVTWLDSITPLTVRVAVHNEQLHPGTVYVAPGDT